MVAQCSTITSSQVSEPMLLKIRGGQQNSSPTAEILSQT
jgi:hypothetical protein